MHSYSYIHKFILCAQDALYTYTTFGHICSYLCAKRGNQKLRTSNRAAAENRSQTIVQCAFYYRTHVT